MKIAPCCGEATGCGGGKGKGRRLEGREDSHSPTSSVIKRPAGRALAGGGDSWNLRQARKQEVRQQRGRTPGEQSREGLNPSLEHTPGQGKQASLPGSSKRTVSNSRKWKSVIVNLWG